MSNEGEDISRGLSEQDTGHVLTLDLTGSPPSERDRAKSENTIYALEPKRGQPELEKYNQPREWDNVRKYVTLGLLAMFGWVILWASIESASWPSHWAQTKEMLQTILPAITGLIGSVIGFYFGSNTNGSDTGNSGNSGNGTGSSAGK